MLPEMSLFSESDRAQVLPISVGGPYGLIEDATDSNRLLVGNYNGLSSIRWDGTSFTDEGYFSGVDMDIPSMAYSTEGTLYLGTGKDGMYSCAVKGSQIEIAQIPLFKGAHVVLKRIGEEFVCRNRKRVVSEKR